jgi:2-desacetyl-2-hydroxyethyl bacteriochlorophyllide A dehydrogenase
MGMNRLSVVFTAPGQASVWEEPLPEPSAGQVLVQTLFTAISPGTEMLVYRGQFPEGLPVDEAIPSLDGEFRYPLRYGYSAVGRVVALGPQVEQAWEGRLVFSFQPHTSHFLAALQELMTLPADIAPENAVFLPNMETAVNLVMDGAPLIGEGVAVFGQGIVGLLTTALLAQFPLSSLVTFDRYALRRKASLEVGASASLEAESPEALKELLRLQPGGADLVYELSGSPAALDQAIAAAAFTGRVVVGSWYGKKQAALDLGGRFHRSRIRLLSSQVSTIAPELSGRWTKARRFQVAWEMLRRIQPRRFITHRLPVSEAPQAYRLLDQSPEETLQVIFAY